jgi:hypothetical protein
MVLVIGLQAPLVAIALVIWLSGSLAVALVYLGMAALYAWLPLWASHVSLGPDGMNVYRSLHKVAWNDVVDARPRSILGLRYLRLQRTRGMAVWLPLYLVSHRRLDKALLDWAPRGNPITQHV